MLLRSLQATNFTHILGRLVVPQSDIDTSGLITRGVGADPFTPEVIRKIETYERQYFG